MAISKQGITDDIINILDSIVEKEKTTKIPNLSDQKPSLYGTDGISFIGAVLFIDLRGSTKLFNTHYDNVIAKILMAYHKGITKISKDNNGDIRSFNGDSLLVFFEGNTKSAINNAVKSAMKISYFIKNILNPELDKKGYTQIDFGIGIDHGNILSVKVGIKDEGNRDLIWIGESVNLSAKMSDNGNNPYNIYISNTIYINLYDETKFHVTKDAYGYEQKKAMWTNKTLNIQGNYIKTYITNYWWSI